MCLWCYLTPACPCRRGGEPPGVAIGKALIAVARRLRRLGRSFRSESGPTTKPRRNTMRKARVGPTTLAGRFVLTSCARNSGTAPRASSR